MKGRAFKKIYPAERREIDRVLDMCGRFFYLKATTLFSHKGKLLTGDQILGQIRVARKFLKP